MQSVTKQYNAMPRQGDMILQKQSLYQGFMLQLLQEDEGQSKTQIQYMKYNKYGNVVEFSRGKQSCILEMVNQPKETKLKQV